MKWRYFYDVAEFLTVITSNHDGFHIGVLTDDPNNENGIIASNNGDSCNITILADNLFTAIK